MNRSIAIISFIFVLIFSAAAQDPNSAATKKAEVKKLEKLAGQWKGSGWIMRGTMKETFSGGELVQKKVDGVAMLVEGKFTNSEGKIIHETLAVISYDDQLKGFRFNTYLANGMAGTHDLKVMNDAFEWTLKVPGGSVRYTTKFENDLWFEIGEFSRDGTTWLKIFEMKLDRVK